MGSLAGHSLSITDQKPPAYAGGIPISRRSNFMNSFLAWIGGKKLLRKEIIQRFPSDFDRYIEVFGGAAWVLFGKEQHAKMEVYNDADSGLVNLFRCVKYHCDELQRELAGYLNSRELFEDVRAQRDMRGMTDIQRAARFFLLIKMSYGSDAHSFGCAVRNLQSSIDYIAEIQQRLQRVVIENKDFGSLIKVYDRPEALFYCDPPYHGAEEYYKASFPLSDHQRLREALGGIKGRFVLSYNDCEAVRNLYDGFTIESVNRQHNLKARERVAENKYCEVIIRNY